MTKGLVSPTALSELPPDFIMEHLRILTFSATTIKTIEEFKLFKRKQGNVESVKSLRLNFGA